MTATPRTFEVDAEPRVTVRIERGTVTLVDGPAGQVTVELDGPGAELMTVDATRSAVTVRPAPGGLLRRSGRVEARLTVPADTQASLALASGDIDVRGPVAELQASAASGDVAAARVGRRTTVKTASGDVAVRSADGELEMTSGSGDLRVTELRGRGRLSTASGRIDLADVAGDVTCKTASGDLSVGRLREGSFTFRTVSGDTRIGIPPGRQVSYDVEAISGRLHLPGPRTDTPAPPPDGVKPRVRIEGRSVSGDTHLQHAAPGP